MKNATVANFESKNLKKVHEIEDRIAENIEKAIEKGEFICTVPIDVDTSKEIRERLIADLKGLNYDVQILNVTSQSYDTITVYWGDEECIPSKSLLQP